ncbi:hypothetical protein [Pelomonas sp. SE-A7]|uniref:hypothetical protein n=1 Tax=Pelomonas sp. SE-A7 TaxID=3054953 RepID=UPI00259C6B30|nr:hypothetical protein [Pelomonas sp. SE-A7]MDM4766844.1 hypothetical protein [Pelomonas sp. SE-A7]
MDNTTCIPYRDEIKDKASNCNTTNPTWGNPVHPLAGSKSIEVALGNIFGSTLSLNYNTRTKVPTSAGDTKGIEYDGSTLVAEGWGLSFIRSLVVQAADAQGSGGIQLIRAPGNFSSFTLGSGVYTPISDTADRLIVVSGGFLHYDRAKSRIDKYDSGGKLLTSQSIGGQTITYKYSDPATPAVNAGNWGMPIELQDQTGRKLQVFYKNNGVRESLSKLYLDALEISSFSYDSKGRLESVAWPDLASQVFVYEATALPWAVTGIKEGSARYARYEYDDTGRAIGTELGSNANRHTVEWGTPPSRRISVDLSQAPALAVRTIEWDAPVGTRVLLPNGESTDLSVSTIQGSPYLTGQSQPAGSGCSASSKNQTFDALGNVERLDGFDGRRSCFAHDPSRGTETVRIEGLGSGNSCTSVLAEGVALPDASRKVSTQWHPDWRLVVRRAEPRRITTMVYNGQPDPFNGNAIASCAPGSALLMDGAPLVVLCKQVEQATTDLNGRLGFSAPLQSGVTARIWQYTYNERGQVLTMRDPRGNTTMSAYYGDTTSGHTTGDLKSVANPLGQVTQYTKYTSSGQVLEMSDANGVVTSFTYDVRQRLTSVKIDGATTTYTYWPTGLLKQVSQPDGSFIGYQYDDAHRLVGVNDSHGNSIEYTLDSSGNRTSEKIKDSSGQLASQITRIFDALGRVQQLTQGVQP